jgi:hypothetical protein
MPAGGGIIQIAAVGRQNDFINKDPNFTLFKTSHNKYTSFAEDFEWQDFNGVIAFGSQKSPATVSRYGDLITDIHLWVTLPAIEGPQIPIPGTSPQEYYETGAYWVNAIGYALMEEVSLEIGSQDIDTLYSDYMFLWEELTQRPGARLRESIGRHEFSDMVEQDMIAYSSQQRDLFVQIPFFFNKYFLEKGLALPLISLTYHEIKIKVTFAHIADVTCVVVKGQTSHPAYDAHYPDKWLLLEAAVPTNKTKNAPLQTTDLVAKLLITYIYLDVEERNTFSQSDHETLVTTLQRQQNTVATEGLPQDSLKLYFNHPSNFLMWVVRPQNWRTNAGRRRFSVGHKDRFDYSMKVPKAELPWGDVSDAITNATLKLNSHERWPENMASTFFRVVQPQLKFENVPTAFLYIFCFSIAGGVWNPTSTLNFSRIEHTQLDFKYKNADGLGTVWADPADAANTNVVAAPVRIPPSDILIFVESYNLLVIKNGMGKFEEYYNLVMFEYVKTALMIAMVAALRFMPMSAQKVGKSIRA